MLKSEAKRRIEKLKKVIGHHRYLYHVLDKQEISDEALDSLKHELAELEKQFPQFVTPDSPTQRVGGEPLEKFEKAQHRMPMLSIDDVFSMGEIVEWEGYLARLIPREKMEYFCEMKLDGFAISLLYKGGLFVSATTRGNGLVGENVTQNIKTIEAIPLSIEELRDVEVRGEIYMDKKAFQNVNREQKNEARKNTQTPEILLLVP